MQYNFFKENNQINIKVKDSKISWLSLKNNPWQIFPNYDNKLDNTLFNLDNIKKEYFETIIEHENQTKEFKKNEYIYIQQYMLLLLSFYSFLVLLSYFFFIEFLPIIVELLLDISKSNIGENGVFFSALLLILPGLLSIMFLKKYIKKKFEKDDTNINKRLNETNEKISSLKRKYKKEVSPLLNNSKTLNIRENLDKKYHTDIPELNMMIQNILEKYYPKDSMLCITSELKDDFKQYQKNSDGKHIKKISNLLHKIIDDKLSLSISEQIDNDNNQLNDNDEPLALTVNGKNKKQDKSPEYTFNYFSN